MRKLSYALFATIAVIFMLYIGKNLLLPLAIAILINFVIQELKRKIGKLHIKGKYLPIRLQSILAFGIIVLGLVVFGNLLYSNVQNITAVLPTYQKNINQLFSQWGNIGQIDLSLLSKEWLNKDMISSSVRIAVESVSGVLSNSLIIFLYLVFILMESNLFSKKIELIYSENNKVSYILERINTSISQYLSLKTLTSFLTGFASFIILYALDINFAFFWAFLIFALNFIPTIGSLVATLFPTLIALLQYGNLYQPLIVLVAIGAVQFLVGNVIEPKIMGTSLNVSPLVVIVSLSFWGMIWGVTGMILSVPLTIVIIIIASQFKSTEWLAILLSENGEIMTAN